jgi:hypothetical protein
VLNRAEITVALGGELFKKAAKLVGAVLLRRSLGGALCIPAFLKTALAACLEAAPGLLGETACKFFGNEEIRRAGCIAVCSGSTDLAALRIEAWQIPLCGA